nr:hypothetical protein [uncultured Aminipila sp.]
MNKREFSKYLLLLLFAVILISGCNKSVEIKDVSGDSNQTDSQENRASEFGQREDEDINKSEETKEVEQPDKNSIEQTEEKNVHNDLEKNEVASVIVKSENNLSDSEKQEVVNQLSNEVDELLNEINSME